MKLWENYLFKETVKLLITFLIWIYFTFILIDISIHGVHYYTYLKPTFSEIFLFYIHQFIGYLDIFLPLTFLLSTMKILLGMRQEISSLQVTGLSSKTLLRPFFFIAIILGGITYVTLEYLLPYSFAYVEKFQIVHSKHPEKGEKRGLHLLLLEDGSKLIYQKKKRDGLFDVFWIRSPDDILHIKSLEENTGYFVDHLHRNEKGLLENVESFAKESFPKLIPQIEPLEKTKWHTKLSTPLFPLLTLIAIAPYCLRFSRHISIFFYYAIALFSLIAFLMLIDAATILAENQIASPLLLIWAPIGLLFGVFGIRFSKSH